MNISAMIITALFLTAAPIGGLIILDSQNFDVEESEPDDTTPPTSSIVSPLFFIKPPTYEVGGVTGFKISWSGSDNAGGSGIDHFDVQYRSSPVQIYGTTIIGRSTIPGLSNWRDLVTNTTETSTFVHIGHERTMEFRVRAVDKSDNEESWSPIAETATVIVTVPTVVHKALVIGHKIADNVEEGVRDRIPNDTPPGSRVLPLSPLTLPEIIVTATDEIAIYQPTEPMYMLIPGNDLLWFISYNSIDIRWEGRDLKGSGDLTYDIQYRRVYLDYPQVYIPETPIRTVIVPDVTEWTDWLTDTDSNEGSFPINEPGLYEFRSRAKDGYGNVEDYPLTADAVTYILPMV